MGGILLNGMSDGKETPPRWRAPPPCGEVGANRTQMTQVCLCELLSKDWLRNPDQAESFPMLCLTRSLWGTEASGIRPQIFASPSMPSQGLRYRETPASCIPLLWTAAEEEAGPLQPAGCPLDHEEEQPLQWLLCSLMALVEGIEQEVSSGQEELGIRMQPFCSA